MNNPAAVGPKRTPASNETHVVGTGKNGQAGGLQRRCDVLTGGIIADILVTFSDNGRNLTDARL